MKTHKEWVEERTDVMSPLADHPKELAAYTLRVQRDAWEAATKAQDEYICEDGPLLVPFHPEAQ